MVYLHGSNEQQQAIADEVSRQATEQLGRPETKPSGTSAPDGIMTPCPIVGGPPDDLGLHLWHGTNVVRLRWSSRAWARGWPDPRFGSLVTV